MQRWTLSISLSLVALLMVVPLLAVDPRSSILVKANCFVECKASSNGKVWVEVPVLVVTDPFSAANNVTWNFFTLDVPGYVDDPNTSVTFGEFDLSTDLNTVVLGGVFGKNFERGPFEINFCEYFERVFSIDAPAVWQLQVELKGSYPTSEPPGPDFIPTVPWIKNFTGSFRRTSRGPLVSDAAKDQVLDPTRGVVTGVAKTTCQLSDVLIADP